MKAIHFNKVTIIGVGLIGGSLAISLRENGLAKEIVGVGRGVENLKTAKRLNLIDSYTADLKEGVKESDLVFVSVPALSIANVIKESVPALKKGCIVTDGGSVKEAIVKDVESFMPKGVFFVGGHPIAGTENSGAGAAFSGLFNDRKCILTPTKKTDKESLLKVKLMWEIAGSEVVLMDARRHDMILAAVSHLPHVIAYALVNTVADVSEKKGGILKYSAGGFKDFTRIASSSPEMWRDICTMNKSAIVRLISEFRRHLDELKGFIEEDKGDSVRKNFERAKRVRKRL